jgi:hypothetical protein
MNHLTSRVRLGLVVAIALLAPSASFALEKPNLFVVSVGASKYLSKNYEKGVSFSAKDAQNVADHFRAQQGKRYHRVETKVLLDEKATLANLRTAMDWLQASATPELHVVVYLSGHGGSNALGGYTYILHDSQPLIASSRMQGTWLRDRLRKVAGRRLLLLDTCHAGGFGFADADFAALASCGSKEQSSEASTLRNGYFTRCLLDGLAGKADQNADGDVTFAELESHLGRHLPGLTKGQQHLTAHCPASFAADLPLVRVAASPPPPAAAVPFAKTGPVSRK